MYSTAAKAGLSSAVGCGWKRHTHSKHTTPPTPDVWNERGHGTLRSFLGSYTNSIDDKGCVSLPAQFRKVDDMEDNVILIPSIDGKALNLFTPSGLETWMDSIFGPEGYQPSNPEQESWSVRYFAQGVHADIDKSGRINIPQNLRERFNLQDKVVFTGARDHAALWNPQAWEKQMEGFDPKAIYQPQQTQQTQTQ